MPLLRYTTTINVDKTLGEIQQLLRGHGARRVTIDYDDNGNPCAVAFLIVTPFGEQEFRLPANLEGVWKVLTDQYETGRVQRRFATKEQAARVGFRILKDWIEAQLAIIDAQMVTMAEVFLPYLLADDGHTVYETFEARRLPLLLPAHER